MAAVVEQCHDQDGICWPISLAPYHVAIVPSIETMSSGQQRDYITTLSRGGSTTR